MEDNRRGNVTGFLLGKNLKTLENRLLLRRLNDTLLFLISCFSIVETEGIKVFRVLSPLVFIVYAKRGLWLWVVMKRMSNIWKAYLWLETTMGSFFLFHILYVIMNMSEIKVLRTLYFQMPIIYDPQKPYCPAPA
jgi:hypothetical protein